MNAYRRDNDILHWFSEHSTIGKTITDILFSGDDPFLDKGSMKSLFANCVSQKKHMPSIIRESDIPDSLSITRGRSLYGCSVCLIFGDETTIELSFDDGKVMLSDREKPDTSAQERHNVNERQLFDPIINRAITDIKINTKAGRRSSGIHNVRFYLDNSIILYVSETGVYILESEGTPMQITMGEKKKMIRNYSALFD